MEGTELGKAYVQIIPSAEGISGKIKAALDPEAQSAGESSGKEYSSTFGDMLKANLVSGAVMGAFQTLANAAGNLIRDAVSNYADFEQLTGGVETLFKESAGLVEEYAAEAYRTAGLSANEYMETVTSFSASLLQSLGGDTEAAAQMADLAITDMSDNANKMGTEMQSIQNAYQGFAKQNYTMLDNLKLGYGGTKTEMKRLLEDAEALKAAHGELAEYSIDSYADVVEAIHVVQTEMGITGTTAAEAASTVQGSIGSMRAAWENLLTGIGSGNADIDKLVDDFVDSAETALDNLMPVVEHALEGLGTVIDKLGPVISEKMPGFIAETTPVLAAALGQIFGNLLVQLPTLIGGLSEGIGMALDQAFHIDSKEYYIDEYGQLMYVMDEVGETAAKVGGRMGAEFTAGLDSASAASEKFATRQQETAAAAQSAAQIVAAGMSEEEQAVREATLSMEGIGLAAYDALAAGGDLGAVYEQLSGEMEKIAGTGDETVEALAAQALKTLELASIMQDLSGEYPELTAKAQEYGFSLQETAQWLQENGLSAEEWAGMVSSATADVVNGFSVVKTDLGLTLDEMKSNLASNIEAYNNWNSNIQQLMDAAKASGSDGAVAFVQYIQDMGIGAADQVQAMMGDIDGTLADFAPLFEGAAGEAMEAVFNEIQGADTSAAVAGMESDIADEINSMDLGDAGSQLPEQVAANIAGNAEVISTAVTAAATEAVAAFDDTDFAPSGTAAVEEIASGITDATDQVESAAEALANAAIAAFDAVDASPSGEAFDSELAAGIEALSGDVGSAAEAVANAAAEQAKIDTSDVGEYLMSGIASGIAAGRSGVISAAVEAVQAAVAAAKEAAAIQSPSKVMRDEVGVFLTKGIAAGMVDAEALYSLESAADTVQEYIARLFGVDLNGEDSDAIKQVKAWKDAWEGALEDTVRNTEHSIFLMEKNGKDYNQIIGAYRDLQKALHDQAEEARMMGMDENDEYLQKLQREWWGYEDEIASIQQRITDEQEKALAEQQKAVEEALSGQLDSMRSLADDLSGTYQDAFNDIMKQQESMQNKLSSYGDLFHLTGTTVSLSNLDSQTKAIERYADVLDSLRNRNINDGLLDEILGMDVRSATLYGQKLLSMTNREWSGYMDSYQLKQDTAARIAEDYFSGDLAELNTSYLQEVLDQLGEMFAGFMAELPEAGDMRDHMAEALTDSFESLVQELLEPILGGGAGDFALDGSLQLAGAQEAAADTRAAERDNTMIAAFGEMSRDIVNGVGGLMDAHMNVGESELSVEVGGETLARILLPYLIATAKANGTPIVSEGG